MIEVTKINGVKVLVNPDLIELVEETPDTVLTLTTGKKIIVKESRQEIKNLVIFKIYGHNWMLLCQIPFFASCNTKNGAFRSTGHKCREALNAISILA